MVVALCVRQLWLVLVMSQHRYRPYRMQAVSEELDSWFVRAIFLQIANQPFFESIGTFHSPFGALAESDKAVSVKFKVYLLRNRGTCHASACPASVVQYAIAYLFVLAL